MTLIYPQFHVVQILTLRLIEPNKKLSLGVTSRNLHKLRRISGDFKRFQIRDFKWFQIHCWYISIVKKCRLFWDQILYSLIWLYPFFETNVHYIFFSAGLHSVVVMRLSSIHSHIHVVIFTGILASRMQLFLNLGLKFSARIVFNLCYCGRSDWSKTRWRRQS